MRKQRVLIYHSRWHGWSIYCNGYVLQLGEIKWGRQLRSFCEHNCKRFGWSIGIEGWEL